MVLLKVKWGGKTYDVTVDPALGVDVFKAQLQVCPAPPPPSCKAPGLYREPGSLHACVTPGRQPEVK